MKTPSWFRTSRHSQAEAQVKTALQLISEARAVLTLGELEEYVRENITQLGYHGFVGSIGEALVNAATIEAKAE